MTEQQAREEIPDIDCFCEWTCICCRSNDWFCLSECETLEKARKLDFDRIIKRYAKYDGDLNKVCKYIKRTKINRVKGGC